MRYLRSSFAALVILGACSTQKTSADDVVQLSETLDAVQDSKQTPTPGVAPARGRVGRKLMIIGNMTDQLVGNVTDDAIYVDRIGADLGGPKQMRVLVVPGAGAEPQFLYRYFQALMPARGVSPNNIELSHIASEDDSTTPDIDESTWSRGAYDSSEVAKLARANVVWFEGGDQSRLTALLLDSKNNPTPFQAALKAKFAAGQVIIAGYSAGAAIMSDPMIGGGSSWEALTLPLQTDPMCNDTGLCVTRGLGYLPQRYSAIIDQHFTQRGRWPRAIRALAATNLRNAWGVSEFTGFYLDLDAGRGEVVGVPGKAFVTLVGRDGSAENHERVGPPFLGDGYTMSLLTPSDSYTLPDAAHPHGVVTHTPSTEVYAPFSAYYGDNPLATDALGSQVLVDQIAVNFADGAPQASGARADGVVLAVSETGAATGFRFRFTADTGSSVAWNENTGYSFFDARLQISQVTAQINGIGP